MNSIEMALFEYYDFGINEDWNTEREKEIKKSICRLYISRLEHYCNCKFNKEGKRKSGQRYFSFEFSKLPLNEDNLRFQVYYSLQHPIRDEIENHLETLQEKYPNLYPEIKMTSSIDFYNNCSLPCYLILESDIDTFILQHINSVPHIEVIKKNMLEEIIDKISLYITERTSEEIKLEISDCKKDYPDKQKCKRELVKIQNSTKYKSLASKNDKTLWEFCFTFRSSGKLNYTKLAECITAVKDHDLHQHFPNKQILIEEIAMEINKSGLLSSELYHKRLFKASPDYKSHKKNSKVRVEN